MSLLERIDEARKPRAELERYTVDDYVSWVNQFSFNGVAYTGPFSQTMQADRESIGDDFVGMVQSAYRSSGIVWACMLARRAVFSEGRFQWRNIENGRPTSYFGNRDLAILERPFPGGVTSDLMARMLDDADLAGNWFGFRDSTELVRLRPDWVDIVLEPRLVRRDRLTKEGLLVPDLMQVGYRKAGYAYYEDGQRDREPVFFKLDEVAHFAPQPDPLANFRGMSWLTPVIREIVADKAATAHKMKFFEQGATPNMVFKLPEMSREQFRKFKAQAESQHSGVGNAYRPMFLGGGADLTVVGANMEQMQFKSLQGTSETRIASAAGVPPVVVGFSEGLQGSSLNTGNYTAARRNFADRTIRPLWRNASASLEVVLPRPGLAELTVDDRDVAFLREDQRDASEIQAKQAQTIRTLVDAGFEPATVVAAVEAGTEWTKLTHSNLYSVQLQAPGTGEDNPQEIES